MAAKIITLAIIYLFVALAYIMMALMAPATTQLVSTANASLQATANMSQFPGTLGAINSFPVYSWFIPGLVAIVSTVVMLVKKS